MMINDDVGKTYTYLYGSCFEKCLDDEDDPNVMMEKERAYIRAVRVSKCLLARPGIGFFSVGLVGSSSSSFCRLRSRLLGKRKPPPGPRLRDWKISDFSRQLALEYLGLGLVVDPRFDNDEVDSADSRECEPRRQKRKTACYRPPSRFRFPGSRGSRMYTFGSAVRRRFRRKSRRR